MREAADGVFAFGAEFALFFRVAAGGVLDEGEGALRGDALEGAVDLLVEGVVEGAGEREREAKPVGAGGWEAFCGGDVEFAVHAVGRGELAADAEFFSKPFHGFEALQGPDDENVFDNSFVVAHFLN